MPQGLSFCSRFFTVLWSKFSLHLPELGPASCLRRDLGIGAFSQLFSVQARRHIVRNTVAMVLGP